MKPQAKTITLGDWSWIQTDWSSWGMPKVISSVYHTPCARTKSLGTCGLFSAVCSACGTIVPDFIRLLNDFEYKTRRI